jgi:hypothetical protein
MEKFAIVFLATMSLAGSGCHKTKRTKDGAAIARMTELKNRMCACKDKACSDAISEELSRWTQAQSKSAGDKAGAPTEDDPEMAEVTEEMTRCILKLEIPGGSGAVGAGDAARGTGGVGGATGGGSAAAGSADGSAAAGW